MTESITDQQFLERIGMIPTEHSLEVIKNLRAALSEFPTVPVIPPQCIHPTHHIESDLGIHHLDSLDLVDLAASIETDRLKLHPDEFSRIAELNRRDGSVRELALLLLDVSRLTALTRDGVARDAGAGQSW